jgi:hypothetical protein
MLRVHVRYFKKKKKKEAQRKHGLGLGDQASENAGHRRPGAQRVRETFGEKKADKRHTHTHTHVLPDTQERERERERDQVTHPQVLRRSRFRGENSLESQINTS